MFPTNSERLIGISDAFSAFVYGYPSSCPLAHCTPNKSVTTLRYTRRPGPIYIQAMPVGTYRVQSPGFPKIVNWMKEETPIMGEFSPTTYAEVICYVKLMGEFSPTTYAVTESLTMIKSWVNFHPQSTPCKCYYVKVMGEKDSTAQVTVVFHGHSGIQ